MKVLSLAVNRTDEKLRAVGKQLEDVELIEKCYTEGKAYTFKNQDLGFELIIDLDTFIFESRSTYEILGKFITEFFTKILEKSISEKDLIDNFKKKKISTDWIEILKESRIFFFHNGAPWIGFKPLDESFSSFEPIMLKRNILELKNKDDYLPFTKLKEIYGNFSKTLTALQEYIIEEIDNFDK